MNNKKVISKFFKNYDLVIDKGKIAAVIVVFALMIFYFIFKLHLAEVL